MNDCVVSKLDPSAPAGSRAASPGMQPNSEETSERSAPGEPSAGRGSIREWLIPCAVVVCVLFAFRTKPFNVDEPLFLWLGQHLQHEPLDYFGFDVNWYGEVTPMHRVTMNPPATGYMLALAGSLVGWSETALHLVFVLPALLATLGMVALARRFTSRPLEAGLIGLATPVFFVSGTSLMCDTSMLALWCWALWCWVRGVDTDKQRWTWAAGLLAGLAGLTKFFGVSLVPLMFAYGLARRRRVGGWAAPLLVPLAIWIGYELTTRELYGHGHLLDAASYASDVGGAGRTLVAIGQSALIGLVFLGGCMAPLLFYGPLVWSRRVTAVALSLAVGVAAFTLARGDFFGLDLSVFDWSSAAPALFVSQFVLFLLGGLGVLALVVSDLRRERSADALLLALWVLGTFAFAALVNWTNNGRSNLPMVPALAILLVRRLDGMDRARGPGFVARAVALSASACVALGVAYADYRWAHDVKASVAALDPVLSDGTGTTYYQGHWGFQWYMDERGARAFDFLHDAVEVGDLLVIPSNNANTFLPNGHEPFLEDVLVHAHPHRWAHTANQRFHANLYASNFVLHTLPFAFGPGPPDSDEYVVRRAKKRFWLEHSFDR